MISAAVSSTVSTKVVPTRVKTTWLRMEKPWRSECTSRSTDTSAPKKATTLTISSVLSSR